MSECTCGTCDGFATSANECTCGHGVEYHAGPPNRWCWARPDTPAKGRWCQCQRFTPSEGTSATLSTATQAPGVPGPPKGAARRPEADPPLGASGGTSNPEVES